MLFDTFVTTVWKPSCAKLRECTKVGYESALNCHILPQWSGRDMDAISVADIESWLDSFDKPGAARKAYAVFRAILRLAFKRGLADNDVTRREIRLPHLRHYEPQVLSAPEVRRLLKGFYGHPLEAWLLVSVCAELRPPIEVNGMVCVSNGQTARMLVVNPNGTIRCANMGATGSNQSCVGSLCYPIP